MEVVCHLGAHCTEGNRIQKTLQKNRSLQAGSGVLIADPAHYVRALNRLGNQNTTKSDSQFPDDKTKHEIASASPDRLVISSERYFGLLRNTLKGGRFYALAEQKLQRLTQIFPSANINVVLIVRNPATFIPALFAKSKASGVFELTDGIDPRDYYWSELFSRLSKNFPQLNFTICCFEDLPFLWGELIRDIIGVPIDQKIKGGFDLFETIVSDDGMKRFRQFLAQNPKLNELQKRRVMTAFLDKFAVEEKLYEAILLPGWDDCLIEELSEQYFEDVLTWERLHNLTLLSA